MLGTGVVVSPPALATLVQVLQLAGPLRRRVKMTRLRARVAERLKGAQNTYAMLTTFNEIDMTNLMQLRSDFKVRAHCGSLWGNAHCTDKHSKAKTALKQSCEGEQHQKRHHQCKSPIPSLAGSRFALRPLYRDEAGCSRIC